MSLPEETMMDLMAYADDELEGDDLARVEALVQSNDEARRVVEAMSGLGDRVREGIDSRWLETHAAPIAVAVMTKLEAEPTVVKRRPLGDGSGNVRSLQRRHVVGVTVGVLAMAAAAMLVLRSNQEVEHPVAQGGGRATTPAEIAPPFGSEKSGTTAVAQASPPNQGTQPVQNGQSGTSGVDVEQVESPSHQVSVFYLPAVSAAANNANASSVVVWIGDDNGGH